MNTVIPISLSDELYDIVSGEAERRKKRENKPMSLPIPVKTKHGWYDCVLGSIYCENYICDHKTKKEAIEHAKEILDYKNSECVECGDGTLICNCPLLFHKLKGDYEDGETRGT